MESTYLFSSYLNIKDPDEVGSQGVVLDQTGDAAAFLVPAGVSIGCEHLDHR